MHKKNCEATRGSGSNPHLSAGSLIRYAQNMGNSLKDTHIY